MLEEKPFEGDYDEELAVAEKIVAEETAEVEAKAKRDKKSSEKFAGLFTRGIGLSQIALTQYQPLRWAIGRILPQSVYSFLRAFESWEDWLCLQAASAVSLGSPFLGNPNYKCSRGKCFSSRSKFRRSSMIVWRAQGSLATTG